MNAHLPRELDRLVYQKVESGRYNSAGGVVREALRLLEERDQREADICKVIAEGLESQGRGELAGRGDRI
jgi:putative addiction module CopG family antidote